MYHLKTTGLLFFVLGMLVLSSCSRENRRTDVDVSGIALSPVRVHRYDLALFRVNRDRLREELEALKPAYRFFLGTDLSDTVKLREMRSYLENPRNLGFHDAVAAQYGDLTELENGLTGAFRHFLHYYPGARVPRVYAYISGGDYDYPVQFADSVLLIGLDNYLGKDFKPYAADGLPYYRIARMTAGNLVPDCMRLMASVTHPVQLPGNNLLEQMIEAGKRLWFIDAMIPSTDDRYKIGYTEPQQQWVIRNEQHVWATIIENRMLYATDGKLIRAFMADGPFTAEFSKEAPPRMGEWIGWRIIRKYMENQPGVSLQEMMNEKDAQKILSLSGYKPEK